MTDNTMPPEANMPGHMPGMPGMGCCGGRWNGRRSWGWCLLKTLLVLVILGAICSLIAHAGMRNRGFGRGPGMMGGRMMEMRGGEQGGMGNMMYFRKEVRDLEGDAASGTVRWLGSVSRVEGNRITIVDNGAKEQVVMSQSSTIIVGPMGEMSLSLIRTGQSLVATGTVAQDGTLTAKMIRVF